VAELDEEQERYLWRRDQLLDLGVDWNLATEYADTVDYHDLEQLIRAGCPPDLALELVRP
jgi:hypothetical protein